MKKLMDLEDKYVAHNYYPLPVVITKGRGAWLYDDKGKKYLDMISSYSATSHGHCNPKLLKALHTQSKKVCIPSRAFYNDQLGTFMKELCKLSGMEMGMPMNTGAEAVETAVKAARKWGYDVKGIKPNKAEIIVAEDNFHGRTTTVVSFSTEDYYREGFGPFTPGFKAVAFGCSPKTFEKAITPNTCAFLVEPIQGEAGIIIPPKGWLKQIAAICKRKKVLLIVDEIQSGLGRSGKTFAFQHENVKPDGLILGKALGGGVYPVSAFLSKKEVMNVFTPGTHGSTFGGNPLGAAVGLEALKVLKSARLVERSKQLGNHLMKELKKIKSPYIADIRGQGLWVGLEMDPVRIEARHVCELLQKEGVLSKETHQTTIRLAPPLVITKKELDWAIRKIKKVLLTAT